MTNLKYEDKTTGVYIEFIIDLEDNSVKFDNMYYEPKFVKVFLLKIQEAINDFIKKKYTVVKQNVTFNDWDTCLKKDSRWRIIKSDEFMNLHTIECKTTDAVDCIANGFGIYPNGTAYKTVM
jgi:hypothetical protein